MTNKEIYTILYGHIKNAYGVCALMGNLYAESGIRSNNLQNSYCKKLGYTDEEYTEAVDNGSYTNFVNDKAGYGLAQWTYWSRKQNLLNYAKSQNRSIGDMEMQLNYLVSELKGYKTVWKSLTEAKSVREASDSVLLNYEKPANQSVENCAKRASYGENFYNELVGKTVNKELKVAGKAFSTEWISTIINGIMVDHAIPCNPNYYWTYSARDIKYIVIHYTGSLNDSAPAECKYYARDNRREASTHFFVDDSHISQVVKLKDGAWHCGTDKTYYHKECRNTNSIGIEMCCMMENYTVSPKTIENTVHLTVYLCKLLGITADMVDDRILRHYDVTHKECPRQFVREPKQWEDFKNKVKEYLGKNQKVYPDKEITYAEKPSQKEVNYKVKIGINNLNIRKGPGTNYPKTGNTTGIGVFTIVAECGGPGSTNGWGKLKSGAGWISLDYATKL